MVHQSYRKVEAGNIPTYEDASPEFLTRRKEELRASMRHPSLTLGEFTRYVTSRVAATMIAAGWTVWYGIERVIINYYPNSENNSKWAERVRNFLTTNNGKNHYVSDVEAFSHFADDIAEDMATFVVPHKEFPPKSVDRVIEKIITQLDKFRLTAGKNELKNLRKQLQGIETIEQIPAADQKILHAVKRTVKTVPGSEPNDGAIAKELLEKFKQRKLKDTLLSIRGENGNAAAGMYGKLLDEMEKTYKGDSALSASRLAKETVVLNRDELIGRAAIKDNEKIINRVRKPGTAIAVGASALIVGVSSYRNAVKQKALEQESELSHIERLERERRHAAREAKENTGPAVA